MKRKERHESIKIGFKKKNQEIEKMYNNETDTPLRFIDLFCGIGGFHIGMKKLNGTCVFACDIDKECQSVYYNNFGIKPFGDICNIDLQKVPDHDILFAGFPCQPFSIAGKQKTFTDERTKPYEFILKILKDKKPAAFVLENVKHLKYVAAGEALRRIETDLEELGYKIETVVKNIYDIGLPQNRERLFIIGNTKKKFIPDISKYTRQTQVTLKSILGQTVDYLDESKYTLLPKDKITSKEKSGLIFCGYLNGVLRKNGIKPNTEHLSRAHKQPNRIYHINGTNPTLSSSETSCRYYIYDGIGVRKLNADNLYELMGFPKEFKKHQNHSTAVKQIGNAVCPLVVENIMVEVVKQFFIQ